MLNYYISRNSQSQHQISFFFTFSKKNPFQFLLRKKPDINYTEINTIFPLCLKKMCCKLICPFSKLKPVIYPAISLILVIYSTFKTSAKTFKQYILTLFIIKAILLQFDNFYERLSLLQ